MGRVVSLEELIKIRNKARQEKKRVVFTNGCFDILHRGHVEYLNKAKELGDILIVGLNTDSSVKKVKGDKRPVIPQEDRAYILSSLRCVDYVCLFDEETPARIISHLLPDVLVKGGDYRIEEIVGHDLVLEAGGEVRTIEPVAGRSSSGIIRTIVERFYNCYKGDAS